MHLGKNYKLYGFSTVTQLIDAACTELKYKLAKEKRAKWREEAYIEYAKSNPKHVWKSIDEQDFID